VRWNFAVDILSRCVLGELVFEHHFCFEILVFNLLTYICVLLFVILNIWGTISPYYIVPIILKVSPWHKKCIFNYCHHYVAVFVIYYVICTNKYHICTIIYKLDKYTIHAYMYTYFLCSSNGLNACILCNVYM